MTTNRYNFRKRTKKPVYVFSQRKNNTLNKLDQREKRRLRKYKKIKRPTDDLIYLRYVFDGEKPDHINKVDEKNELWAKQNIGPIEDIKECSKVIEVPERVTPNGYDDPVTTNGYGDPKTTCDHDTPDLTNSYDDPVTTNGYGDPKTTCDHDTPDLTNGYDDRAVTDDYDNPATTDDFDDRDIISDCDDPARTNDFDDQSTTNDLDEPYTGQEGYKSYNKQRNSNVSACSLGNHDNTTHCHIDDKPNVEEKYKDFEQVKDNNYGNNLCQIFYNHDFNEEDINKEKGNFEHDSSTANTKSYAEEDPKEQVNEYEKTTLDIETHETVHIKTDDSKSDDIEKQDVDVDVYHACPYDQQTNDNHVYEEKFYKSYEQTHEDSDETIGSETLCDLLDVDSNMGIGEQKNIILNQELDETTDSCDDTNKQIMAEQSSDGGSMATRNDDLLSTDQSITTYTDTETNTEEIIDAHETDISDVIAEDGDPGEVLEETTEENYMIVVTNVDKKKKKRNPMRRLKNYFRKRKEKKSIEKSIELNNFLIDDE